MAATSLTRAQTAAKNAFGLLLGTVGEGALQFVFVVLVSRHLGPDNFGFWGFSVALIGYLTIAASFGLPQIVVREISRNPSDAPQIFGAAMGLRLLLGLAIWIVMMAVLSLTNLPFDRRLTFLILSIALLLMPFDLASFFDAHQKSRWDAFFRVIGRTITVGTLGIIVLAHGRITLPLAALTNIAFLVCNIGLAWIGIRYLQIGLRPHPSRTGIRRMFTLALPIFWAQAMYQVYIQANLILLGFLSTDRETGYYAVADRVVQVLVTLKAIAYRLLLPLLSEVAEDHARLTKRLEIIIPLLIQLTIPASVMAILVADPLIEMVFGDVYSPSVLPFRILAGYLIFTGVGSIFGTTLFAIGRQREYTLASTVGTGVNVGLCFVLIPRFGAVGAALSSATATITVMVTNLLYLRRYLRPAFALSFVRTAAACAVMAAIYYATPVHGTFAFVPKLLVAVIFAGATMWVTGEINRAKIRTLWELFHQPRSAE
jgi:O-antigen/teichoic acid export membrane protein